MRNKYIQVDQQISEPVACLFCMFALAAGLVVLSLVTALLLDQNKGFF